MANKANDDKYSNSYEYNNDYSYWKRPQPRERKKRAYLEPTQIFKIQERVLKSKGYDETRKQVSLLYEHWEMVFGEDLAKLALPIGYRNKILLIAAEDSMALNELNYYQEEILERIHAFMDNKFFERVEFHLLQGKTPLNKVEKAVHFFYKTELIRPENLGKLNLPEGKVKDAYLHYLSLFE